MTIDVRFSWQVLYRLSCPIFRTLANSALFKASEAIGYRSGISVSNGSLYHPINLEPTNLLHRILRKKLEEEFHISIIERNFPYKLPADSFGRSLSVGASIQIFLPDIVSIKIIPHGFHEFKKETVFNERRLENHRSLIFLTNLLATLINGEFCSRPNLLPNKLETKPNINLRYTADGDVLSELTREFLAAFLINDVRFTDTDTEVFNAILKKNIPHNRKGEKARVILIDKQGILSAFNSNATDAQFIELEIQKRERLFALGVVLSNFYETYPSARIRDPREMDYLFFSTKGYIKNSDSTFKKSFSNRLAWELIVDEFRLSTAFESARRFDANDDIAMAVLFDRMPNPRYSDSEFWKEIDDSLGEEYVKKQTGGIQISVQNNSGSIAVGDHSKAISQKFKAGEFREVLNQIGNLRAEVIQRYPDRVVAFDGALSQMKHEVSKPEPEVTKIQEALKSLRSITEGIGAGLLVEAGKLLL